MRKTREVLFLAWAFCTASCSPLRASPPFLLESVDRTRGLQVTTALVNEAPDSPNLVTVILAPTLGAPVRVESPGLGKVFEALLSQKPEKEWTWHLLPSRGDRDVLERYGFRAQVPDDQFTIDRLAQLYALRSQLLDASACGASGREIELVDQAHAAGAKDCADVATCANRIDTLITPSQSDGVAQNPPKFQSKIDDVIEMFRAARERSAVGQSVDLRLIPDEDPDGNPEDGWRVRLGAPAPLAPGLYDLVVLDSDGRLVDLQPNAVYTARPRGQSLHFVVAADIQWGAAAGVQQAARSFIRIVNLMERQSEADQRPEFVVVAGDLVDSQYGSATDANVQKFGSARLAVRREYRQVWLALAGLEVPAYAVPGNHDGYRFEPWTAPLFKIGDGLSYFRATLGPVYQAFDFGSYRFVLMNSYDLPREYRTIRRSLWRALAEGLNLKTAKLNWGGGIGKVQHEWLKQVLETRGQQRPLLFLHHDPRGAYAALAPPQSHLHAWDTERHRPIPLDSTFEPPPRAPRFCQTREEHVGYYSPIRALDSSLGYNDWFEGISTPPDSRGYPGWIRYQQEWHLDRLYGATLGAPAASHAAGLVPPGDLLRTIANGGVRAIFKGHDNRFARADVRRDAGNIATLFRADTACETDADPDTCLSVIHVADVSDAESDGHGFLLVDVWEDGRMAVTIRDNP